MVDATDLDTRMQVEPQLYSGHGSGVDQTEATYSDAMNYVSLPSDIYVPP